MKKRLFLIGLLVVSFLFIFFVFEKLEEEYLIEKSNSINSLIENDLDNILKSAVDWGKWEESVKFMKTHSDIYIKSNINENTLKNLGIDFMIYFSNDKECFYAFFVGERDNFNDKKEFFVLKLKTKFYNQLSTENKLIEFKTISEINNKLYMLAFSPITNSKEKPPAYGTLVFGRIFNNNYLMKFNKIFPDKISIVKHSPDDDGNFDIELNTVYIPIKDYQGNVVSYIKVDFEHYIYIDIARWLVTFLFILLGFLLYYFFKSESKSIKKDFQEKLDLISFAIDQSKTGVILSKFNGDIFYVNKIVCDVTGYRKEELIGKHHSILLEAKMFQETFFKEVLDNKGYWKGELNGKTKDGKKVELEVNITPVFDRNNKKIIKCFITTCEFVSDKKKYIEYLQKAKEDMEDFNKIRDSFFARVSHEFKTPITGMKGFVELLEFSNLDERQKKYLMYLKESVEKMEKLFDNVIYFIKGDEIAKSIKFEPFSLPDFIKNSIIANFKQKANEKGLLFKAKIDGQIPQKIISNKDILKKILSLIIENAIKFTEKGSIELYCNLISIDEKEKLTKVCFKIKDTGIGILEDDLEKLFIPLSQKDVSASRKFDGMGLGLTIAKKLVEALDGKIIIDSDKDGGTEVRLIFDFKFV